MNKHKLGFTLVEVLISLTIIGVVAAMTMPNLITTIQERIKQHKIKVFETKLKQGFDLLNVNNGIGPYYNSTEELVKELSKYIKIQSVCTSGNMEKCFTNGVIYNNISNTPKNVNDYKTGKDLGQYSDNNNEYGEVIGVVFADGTPMMMTWNLKCPISDSTATGQDNTLCISGLYDINSHKAPNRWGKDIIGYHAGFSKVFSPTGISKEECENLKNKLGIKYCYERNNTKDKWAGAVKQCGGISNMLTASDAAWIISKIYTENGIPVTVKSSTWEYFSNPSYYRAIHAEYHPDLVMNEDSEFVKDMGLTAGTTIWLAPEVSSRLAPQASFNKNSIFRYYDEDRSYGPKAICKGNF